MGVVVNAHDGPCGGWRCRHDAHAGTFIWWRVLLGVAAFPLMVVALALAAALDAILRLHRRLR